MSGEQGLTAQQKLDKLDAALSAYENTLGLEDVRSNGEAKKYLNITHAELSKMTDEQCGEASVVLAQFGFHLQKALNRETAIIAWCEDATGRAIAQQVTQYDAKSADERKALAIKDNDYATKLQMLKTQAQARVNKINYLPSKTEWLSRTLLELQQTKRRKNGHA